ncbi:hypothetical protein Tco_1353474 [Tanacetum coccineum]
MQLIPTTHEALTAEKTLESLIAFVNPTVLDPVIPSQLLLQICDDTGTNSILDNLPNWIVCGSGGFSSCVPGLSFSSSDYHLKGPGSKPEWIFAAYEG